MLSASAMQLLARTWYPNDHFFFRIRLFTLRAFLTTFQHRRPKYTNNLVCQDYLKLLILKLRKLECSGHKGKHEWV